ncbi:hypothetical protein CHLRE_16g683600v5 [Chlamydomonas reinhardtii]|uniref:Uncharacterized protein n=1 Tax=Chlamydomonas reinhardtii TaxID=3055 RepID=A0A2K3CUV7_CHLRE|nr:uncharacterized protein CHLRE_16g683600v5 [Chlamydomonas reinhardtii]XP_042915969.1 uncharacterized protein CHLRE_16g683600v5 [Chlamydomonas reinhardtii]PNW72072.1 hypothetical protein CHLRE_16g683600v5 [Chlamydomonas reinhardtii]PNW72073.1 hypothetical protein CHLRE_16g683600v5 [Chlamydomonas reinhardtii]
MKAAHEQQLQTSKMLEERAAEDEAFRRLVLKPEVIALASTFIARVISGKPRSGSTCSSGMKGFIKENSQLVGDLAKAAKLDCSPEEFAEFADKNYTLNDDQHKALDEVLINSAKKLKEAGAVRLLRDKLGWQCSLIENMEELVKLLNEAP